MTVLTYTASPLYVTLFTKDPEVMARSVRYIKMFTAMIIPLAVQYPLVDETTALGHVRLALFLFCLSKDHISGRAFAAAPPGSPEATFFSSEPIADLTAALVTSVLFFRFFPALSPRGRRRWQRKMPDASVQPQDRKRDVARFHKTRAASLFFLISILLIVHFAAILL